MDILSADKKLYYTHYIFPVLPALKKGRQHVFKRKKMNISSYTIELREIHLYAHHGVMPQERRVGAWFTIDAKLEISDKSSLYSDEIEGTVSYADVYEIIKEEMLAPANLLENVGKRIIERLFDTFEQVEAIEFTLCKDTPPMGGDRLKACVSLKAKR